MLGTLGHIAERSFGYLPVTARDSLEGIPGRGVRGETGSREAVGAGAGYGC